MDYEKGLLFDADLQKALKEKFYYADFDHTGAERLFFDNSGGSLRLKAAVEAKARAEMLPDCPERFHKQALGLTGAIRVSPPHCHGAEDIDRFLTVTKELAQK